MSDSKSPKTFRSFSTTVSRFADRTSVVGPSYINTSRHTVSKIIWLLFFLGGLGMTIYMVTLNFTRYYSREVKSSISLSYSQLAFPMVTICNTNPVRLSQLHRAGPLMEQFVSELNPAAFARTQEQEATTKAPPLRKKRFVQNSQRLKSSNTSFVDSNFFDYEPDLTGETAAQFDVERNFNYMFSQLPSNFTLYQTSDNGNCYQFNHGKNGAVSISRRTGLTYGLQLIFYLEVDEYITGLTLGYGMRLALSTPKSLPPISSEGLLISSGAESSVGIQLVNISRMSQPYGNCSAETANSFLTQLGLIYTRSACQETCEPRSIYLECGCTERGTEDKYPADIIKNTRQCNSSDVSCINRIKTSQLTSTTGSTCDCPTACREYAYQTTVSSREWPEELYMHSLVDGVCNEADDETCKRLIAMTDTFKRRNFAKVNVFYRNLNYETISETQDYPESSFYSDLGGSIGLWLGLSVLSLLEVGQLLLEICYGILKKCVRKGEISASHDRGRANGLHDQKLTESSPPPRESDFPVTVFSHNDKVSY